MTGAIGLGLRNELISDLLSATDKTHLDFLELAPENWMGLGGLKAKQLDQIAARYPLVAHGLSLSIGDSEPLNTELILRIKQFLIDYDIDIYSEHLSFGRDAQGYLYDLLPVPFYEENLQYLTRRIHQTQDLLGRKIALENISYYHQYPSNMPEIEFINALLKSADCDLLLDINNVYVNSQNHGYDPYAFISAIPADRVRYMHIAGHYCQSDDFILDTHGKPVTDAVWDLLKHAYSHVGTRPTLLERDHYVPSLSELRQELAQVAHIQTHAVPDTVKKALNSLSNGIRHDTGSQKSIRVYHELLSFSINAIIESGFPRLFQTITSELKRQLLQDFLKYHPCTSPEHHQLPTEFLKFLLSKDLPEILKKIAEYEWLELEVEIVTSQQLKLVSLPFDLDALNSSYIPILSNETFFRIVYRDSTSHVRQTAIAPYTARLIQLLQDNIDPTTELGSDAVTLDKAMQWLNDQGIISTLEREKQHESVN